jgi:hypothetical protein
VAYAVLAEGLRTEEELEELDIRAGMIADPAEEAIAALRAHQEAMGMTWDDTPVPEADPWSVMGGDR